jgi:hypothetical protein
MKPTMTLILTGLVAWGLGTQMLLAPTSAAAPALRRDRATRV